MMNKNNSNIIDYTLTGLDELLKKVSKLEIRLSKSETETFKRKRQVIHHTDLIHSYEYSFGIVDIVDDRIIAIGRPITLYDIKEGYTVDSIALFTLNEDKEYVHVYTEFILSNFPKGGTFTFEGKLTLTVSVNE